MVGDESVFLFCPGIEIDHLPNIGQFLLLGTGRVKADQRIAADCRVGKDGTLFNNVVTGIAALPGNVVNALICQGFIPTVLQCDMA